MSQSDTYLSDTGKLVRQIARSVARQTVNSPDAVAPVVKRGLDLGVPADELEGLLVLHGPTAVEAYLGALERSQQMQTSLQQFAEAMQAATVQMMSQIGPMIAQLYHQLVDAGWIEKESDE